MDESTKQRRTLTSTTYLFGVTLPHFRPGRILRSTPPNALRIAGEDKGSE